MEFEAYLEALASAEPAPGGGSAATLVGAMAAALCAMVARISAAAPKLAPVHEEAAAIARDADDLRRRFTELRPRDEAAFRAVIAAQALPRTPESAALERRAQLQRALIGAAEAPLEAALLACEAFALTIRAAALRNANLVSDVECAMHFTRAAFAASAANVAVNHRYIKDPETVARQRDRLTAMTATARSLEVRIAAAIGT